MKKTKLLFLSILIINLLFATITKAQKTLNYGDYEVKFKRGVELFEKEKYGSAQKQFEELRDNSGDLPTIIKSEIEYYIAICAVELFNKDAEYLITSFISLNPESPNIEDGFFEMGKYQYRKKRYSKVIEYFNQVDPYKLENEEVAEYYFKLGYSYFVKKDFEKAGLAFYEIKDVDTKYTVPALYYYSHISYINKNYQTALQGFEKLSQNETFAPIVPYYITQIYYLQNKYDKVIEYAPALLEVATTKRQPEIARVIGEAYYRTNNFAKAIPFLEKYKEQSASQSEQDVYELGYAYYRAKQYEKAILQFKEIMNNQTAVAQNAFYHLADCFLKINDKKNARIAFLSAAKLEFDDAITEDALFNYAKLSYELADSPFNEAIKALNVYIKRYPNSERNDEVYNYLGKVFMTTKNYQGAIESFENVEKINDEIEMAYQRVTFFRGLELFNDLDFGKAIINFDKSLNNAKYNASYKAQCNYWKGEAYYRVKRFADAVESYKQFLLTTGAITMDEYNVAHYNIAYSYFKLKNYNEAITWFRKYTNFMEDAKSKMVGDSYVRVGDCYFVSRKYNDAISFYQKAIDINTYDVDYSMFQKGFSLGLIKEHDKKILVMNQLLNDFPKSNYCDDALYELGRSYSDINENEMAISTFQRILDEYPASSYGNKALLQMGLIHYNHDRLDEALAAYKQVAESSKESKESRDALFGIKNIYVEKNDVDSYIAYTKELGEYANVSEAEQDSLIYISAENLYMAGNCEEALQKFGNYIRRFSEGTFIINAQYYKAECHNKRNELNEAITAYDFVASKTKNKFTEHALIKAARIYYYLKNYNEALAHYSKLETIAELRANVLEALIGKMNSLYLLNKYEEAIKASIEVLLADKLPDESFRRAHYILAQSYFAKNDIQSAIDEFQLLSNDCKNSEGAEAKYHLIEIYYNQKDYETAEKEIFDFVEKNTPHQIWLAKSFLILSDIYVNKNDNFQAKHTLQSVIDNYGNKTDGIIKTAETKLEKILEEEQEKEQLKEVLDIQIKFDDNTDGKYDDLFEETPDEKTDEVIETSEIKEVIKEDAVETPTDSIPNE